MGVTGAAAYPGKEAVACRDAEIGFAFQVGFTQFSNLLRGWDGTPACIAEHGAIIGFTLFVIQAGCVLRFGGLAELITIKTGAAFFRGHACIAAIIDFCVGARALQWIAVIEGALHPIVTVFWNGDTGSRLTGSTFDTAIKRPLLPKASLAVIFVQGLTYSVGTDGLSAITHKDIVEAVQICFAIAIAVLAQICVFT